MRRTYHLIRRHKLLAAALVGSALLHIVLLTPLPEPATPPITLSPVINAQLQTEQPTQQRLQDKNEAHAVASTQINKMATTAKNATNSATEIKSVIKQPTSNSSLATPGLIISDDELSNDPLERTYQQQILAHLRNKVRAPADLHGSVRLEISFQYRQVATKIQVLRPSGNNAVDEWAVRAVMAANPFPSIPPELPAHYVFRPTVKIEP